MSWIISSILLRWQIDKLVIKLPWHQAIVCFLFCFWISGQKKSWIKAIFTLHGIAIKLNGLRVYQNVSYFEAVHKLSKESFVECGCILQMGKSKRAHTQQNTFCQSHKISWKKNDLWKMITQMSENKCVVCRWKMHKVMRCDSTRCLKCAE